MKWKQTESEQIQPLLRIEHAGAERGSTFWLRDVNLELEPGTFMGVIGRNGAGKTTLFHMLCGLSRISQGEVWLEGISMKEEPGRCRQKMGLIFDDDYFRLDLSVKYAARVYGKYYENYSQNDFLCCCRKFEVDIRQNVRKLSKGNYMKFQLAFALAHHPRLILMDEPEAGLDPVFRREWMNMLYDILDDECSILFATHLTEELEQYADAVTLLSQGRQIFSLTMPQLEKQYRIVRGSKVQMDYLQKRLVGRRKMEHYEEGLFQEDGRELWVEVSESRPTLAQLMEYLDGKF
ncbi:ABC transporter ATP-binding protein [Petralouisia muris]|uniref:ABC transporter ATP-binding protein n=1 Tax=Petralouisia muris TaxID=3032872 RepID=A0AC61RWN1_9FIRM|nr:ABC transporter ATP-binding protein [Petralouisia muris]TGY96246.1 ABC transporter ATP-binding protein [Petralouisia muris]